jgi:peptide/nickel transport system substrate-binding protein
MEHEVSRRSAVRGAAALATAMVAAACSSGSSTSGSTTSASASAGGPSASPANGDVVASSSAAPTASGPVVTGGDLIITRTVDPTTLNKTQLSINNESIYTFDQIFETLYTVSDDGKGTRPYLATGYTMSADKMTYTFALRPGVTFSDGKPLTAADVKFSIDDATTAAGGWGFINAAIKSVEAPSDSTVIINLKYPWAPLIADISLFANGIIPANHGGRSVTDFYNSPIGTGPFMWGSWEKGSKLTLKKNPTYWQQGKPYLDSVTWTNTPDTNTRALQVRAGQADIDEFPSWSTVASLKADSSLRVDLFSSTRTDYLAFCEKSKPFQDVHVRRAISYAIDRQAIIKAVLFGNGSAANSFFPPTVPYYSASNPGIQYDMASAKKELALSTVPKGFSTTLLLPSGNADYLTIAEILQSALKGLGIVVTISQLDAAVVSAKQSALSYDMMFTGWTMDIPDPDELVTFAVSPKGGTQSFYTGYTKPALAADAALAAKTLVPATRTKLYSEIQATAAADAFLAPLYYSPYAYASSTKVNGFYVTPLGNYHLENVWKSA